MRCRRCHTKLAPGKKTCPVCGTLILKRRGSVRLASTAGGSRFAELLPRNVDMRKVLLLIIVAAIIVFGVWSIASGCASCESCGGCGSCAACSDCGGCGSCAACVSCGGCGSCAACKDEEKQSENPYDPSFNGSKASAEYYDGSNLYYFSDGNLMALSNEGVTSIIAAGGNMTNICADDEYVYYLQSGNIWATPKEKPMTVTDDPQEKYASVRLINATVSGSDAGVMRVGGFGVHNGVICYWGVNSSGVYNIYTRKTGEYSSTLIHSGALTNVQMYSGMVFFISRDEADSGILYCVNIADGAKRAMTESAIGHYAVSGGSVYCCSYVNGENTLSRINLKTAEIINRWTIGAVDGLMANDEWIYYYVNDASGGNINRMKPGSAEAERIFHDESRIMLTGVAGDCFSVYTDVGETAEDRLTNAHYYIFNAKTREQIYMR